MKLMQYFFEICFIAGLLLTLYGEAKFLGIILLISAGFTLVLKYLISKLGD